MSTPPLVTALLEEQHPDLASLPVQLVANGWDNAMFRIGTDLTAAACRGASWPCRCS